MSYTEEDVIKEINELMYELGIDYFPTHNQMKNNNHSSLSSKITKIGGSNYIIKKYNYKHKDNQQIDKNYTEETVIEDIRKIMYTNNLDYIPPRSYIEKINSKLISQIGRVGGFKYLSNKYNIPLSSDFSKNKYSDEYIYIKLKDMISKTKLEYFPTRQEMIDFCNGNNHLCNLVYKRGGCKYWADKVGLPLKESDTKTGWLGEDILQEKLLSLNYKVEKQTTGNGFDFLVEDYVKTECKYSHLYKGGSGNFYAFNLDSSAKNSDIIVFICEDDNGDRNFLVIPTFKILNITTLSVGENKSKYYQYMDKFNYIDKYKQFFQNLS